MLVLKSSFSFKLNSFVRATGEPFRFSQEQGFPFPLKHRTQIATGDILTVRGSLQPCSLGRLPQFIRVAFTQAVAADNWHSSQNPPSLAHGRHC